MEGARRATGIPHMLGSEAGSGYIYTSLVIIYRVQPKELGSHMVFYTNLLN
jgi:hypothetical protein